MHDRETGAFAPVLFSVIIVTYNSADTIGACIASVVAAGNGNQEIIVVDNNSSDTTPLIIEAIAKLTDYSIRLIANRHNLGYSAAINQGIRSSTAPWLVFLNPDTVVPPRWLEYLRQHFQSPNIAAVGPISNFAAGRQSVASHWDGALPEGMGPEEASTVIHGLNNGKAEETRLLIGFCLMTRREVVDRIGGLDERLFLGTDDLEFSWRARLYGYRLLIATDCFVYHKGQHSFGTMNTATTSALVRRSENALFGILEESYGKGRVPDPIDLWDIDWFTPDNACYNQNVASRQLLYFPKGSSLDDPLYSVIILTWNQIDYTRECLDALQRTTPERHEVIIVDNGSRDGTVEWLQEHAAGDPRCRLVLNSENRGFAAGCNQGLSIARGEWLVLLNNDVVVTPDWLQGLSRCHHTTPHAGIVGPLTNSASGIQGLGEQNYHDAEELEGFARNFMQHHLHRRVFSRRLVGFCMLFSRDLYREIGGLDERFGTGNYEDDDLCLRSAIAGYRNMVVADTYVHHHGSVSFRGSGMDYRAAISGTWSLFRDKWSKPVDDPHLAQRIAACRLREDAERLMLRQQYPDAAKLLKSAIEDFPGDHVLRNLYGKLLAMEGHLHEAATYGNLIAQARVLVADKQTRQAEQLLHGIMEDEPGCGEALLLLSEIARAKGEMEYADALLMKGFTLSPPEGAEQLLKHLEAFSAIEMEGLVEEAVHLYPESRAVARLNVLAHTNPEHVLAATESYVRQFGVDGELLERGLAARRILGPHCPPQDSLPAISLCMIVRDEQRHLPDCLASCRPLVSQIVVVDTGSNDATPSIAELFGAMVIHQAWHDDFSEARNRGLDAAKGDWILVMDADERLSPRDYPLFLQVMGPGKPCAYSMTTRNYCNDAGLDTFTPLDGSYPEEEAGSGWTPSDKIRLFPRNRGIRFEGLVHELVETSVEKAGLSVCHHPVPIHHYGCLERARLERKRGHYYHLGRNKLQQKGEYDPKALYELAIQAAELERYDEARELWLTLLRLEPDVASAWFNLGYVLLRSGQINDALAATERALSLKPVYRPAVVNRAICRFVLQPLQVQLNDLSGDVLTYPDEPALKIMLNLYHCLSGLMAEGVEGLKHLQQSGANPGRFIDTLADLMAQAGRAGEAGLLKEMSCRFGNGGRKS